MSRYDSFVKSLGQTPLTRLERLSEEFGVNIWVKQERCNPAGSVKDRVAWYMIKDAIERGAIVAGHKDVTVVEPTSGNTGIGLAAVCAALDIPISIVMPETMSEERRKMIAIYGAKLVLTPGNRGMKGAIEEAERMAATDPEHVYLTRQFSNPANARAHYETTGPEIAAALGVDPDWIVAGVGTGGTVTGLGQYFGTRRHGTRMVAVEPATSPVISQALHHETLTPGTHGIQGIGAGFIPDLLDLHMVHHAEGVSTEEAIRVGRELIQKDGISCGISGGAAVAATLQCCRRGQIACHQTVVVILPDGLDKYLSTPLAAAS